MNESELKQAIEAIFSSVDENGDSYLGKHMDFKAKEIVGSLTLRFGIAFIALILTGAGLYYHLYYQVQNNTESINKSDIYTKSEADAKDAEVQRQFQEQNEKIVQLRSDMSLSVTTIQSDIRQIRDYLITHRN